MNNDEALRLVETDPERAANMLVEMGKRLRSNDLSKEITDYPVDLFRQLIHNNSPYAFYIFQWVPYQDDAKRWRLKMQHDVKSFSGEVQSGIWPNGDRCGKFRDREVEFIRISKKQFSQEWKDPRDDILN